MPMYDYKCSQCGQVFEVKQRFADEPLTTHEGCGGSVERLISAPALVFKGSGFYITDYARGSAAGPAASANGSKKEGSSSGDSKSGDSKSSSNSSEKSGSSDKSSGSSDKSSSSTPSTSSSSSSSSSDTKK